MRILPYILYLFLIAFFEVILKNLTSIYGVSINLTALIVMLVAIYKSEVISLWFGFVAGLVMAAGAVEFHVLPALITSGLGLAAFHAWRRLNFESVYSKLLVVFIGTFLHYLLLLLVEGGASFFYVVLIKALPGAIYTTVIAYFFFLIVEGRISYQKIKSLF